MALPYERYGCYLECRRECEHLRFQGGYWDCISECMQGCEPTPQPPGGPGGGGGGGGRGGGGGGGGGGGINYGAIRQAFGLTEWDEYLLEAWRQLLGQSQEYLQRLAGLRETLGAELEAIPRRKEELQALLERQAREAHGADVYATGIPVAGAHELALQRALQEAGVMATDWARRATMEIAGALQQLYAAPLQFANPMALLRPDIAGIPREMNIQAYLQAFRERMAQQDLLLRILSLFLSFNPFIIAGA